MSVIFCNSSGKYIELDASEKNRILLYLYLIPKTLKNLKLSPFADLQELHSVGLQGLISACQRYKPEQDSTFKAYAITRIRGAILDELRRLDWMSRTSRARYKQLQSATHFLEQKFGRKPTQLELCENLNISAQKLEKIQQSYENIQHISLNAQVSDDEQSLPIAETLADERQLPSYKILEQNEHNQWLHRKIKTLSDRQQSILILHYFQNIRFCDIAQQFRVSEARICQLHVQALRKLRNLEQ